jgi:hypothetical protein
LGPFKCHGGDQRCDVADVDAGQYRQRDRCLAFMLAVGRARLEQS